MTRSKGLPEEEEGRRRRKGGDTGGKLQRDGIRSPEKKVFQEGNSQLHQICGEKKNTGAKKSDSIFNSLFS